MCLKSNCKNHAYLPLCLQAIILISHMPFVHSAYKLPDLLSQLLSLFGLFLYQHFYSVQNKIFQSMQINISKIRTSFKDYVSSRYRSNLFSFRIFIIYTFQFFPYILKLPSSGILLPSFIPFLCAIYGLSIGNEANLLFPFQIIHKVYLVLKV